MDPDIAELSDQAYAAWNRGELHLASRHFASLLDHDPKHESWHYMRGLVHKYLRDWPTSLRHNLTALELSNEPDDATCWNAGIAATALGNWNEARRLWSLCGITLPGTEGPVDGDFGVVSIRLNAWGRGETLFARRIDIVRSRLLNVPLPESGYRFGDIVLHDGAKTGSRFDGETEVPVFNALERLTPSEFQTFTVFVECNSQTGLDALLNATAPGIGFSEDWTSGITYYCLRCSYNVPHRHKPADNRREWQTDRTLGIAAQSRRSVEKLLHDWASPGSGRRIVAIESRETAVSAPEDGHVWWTGPDDGDQ